ncbi:MAG: phosphodiester glycosidase family protein [Polyangiaceae bacterium]|nr:phosphodiester glycosidase family protein [Polyangiaceae bacterium]
MTEPARHQGLAFPYDIAVGRDMWDFHPPDVRLGVLAVAAASVLLGSSILYGWGLPRRATGRHQAALSRVQSLLFGGLLLVVLSQLVVIVVHLVGLVGLVVDSGLAKVRLAFEQYLESLQWLGTWGVWAANSAAMASFLFYVARTRQAPANPTPSSRARRVPGHVLLGAFATALVIAANLLFGTALRRLVPPVDEHAMSCWDTQTRPCIERAASLGLKHAYYVAFGCTLAGAVCFALGEAKRPRVVRGPPGTPWLRRLLVALFLLSAVALTVFTQPLVRESESLIPLDHAFANLTLSIPPSLSYTRGVGPDEPYFGGGYTMRLERAGASRWVLPEAESPRALYQLVRKERERGRTSGGSSGEPAFDVSIDERLSPQQLREWLASLFWADTAPMHVALVLSHVIELERPVLGRLAGVKWSAARFEVRASAKDCARLRGPVVDLAGPAAASTPDIVRRIVDARRRGQTPCLAVGGRTCLSSEPGHPNCLDRLGSRLTTLRTANPGDGLRAARLRVEAAEFDILEVDDPDKVLFRFDGARALPEARRALEKQRCTVFMTMNAGMYEPNHEPVGLFVSEGRVLQPLNERDDAGNFYMKPNGVFTVGTEGARIAYGREMHSFFADASQLRDPIRRSYGWNATQSGPMLLMAGREHPEFDANSRFRAIRNAVGVRGRDADAESVLFAISNTEVTFHELATLFTLLGYPDALYLDGNVSRMDLPALGRIAGDQRLGPILAVADCPRD